MESGLACIQFTRQMLPTFIGAFLATFGGIIGAIYTFRLTQKGKLHDDKKNAYFNLLSCCERAATLEPVSKDEFLNELVAAKSYIWLYGNTDTKREYNKFFDMIMNKENQPKQKELLRAQISLLVCVMKVDLKIADKKEKQIAKKLRKEGPNNAN